MWIWVLLVGLNREGCFCGLVLWFGFVCCIEVGWAFWVGFWFLLVSLRGLKLCGLCFYVDLLWF